jgi:hypothetical protein
MLFPEAVDLVARRSSPRRPTPKKEDAMKYILLIHQGDTPTPGSDEWESLTDDEKGAVYAAYKALNETPGFTSGVQMQPPETATTVQFRTAGP